MEKKQKKVTIKGMSLLLTAVMVMLLISGSILLYASQAVDIPYDGMTFDQSFLNVLFTNDEYNNAFFNTANDIESIDRSKVADYDGVLIVSGKGLTSLKGIEYFTSLQELYCDNNKLTAIDLSGLSNLDMFGCDINNLTSLDLTDCINLTWTSFNLNQLTELKVTGLSKLKDLGCGSNQLTELDLSGLVSLKYLYCDNNQLKMLNVSGLQNLESIWCYENQLTNLNVSGLYNLQYLSCYNNYMANRNDIIGLEETMVNKDGLVFEPQKTQPPIDDPSVYGLYFDAIDTGVFYLYVAHMNMILYEEIAEKWQWDSETKTLTLKGLVWKTTASTALIIKGDVVLNLEGENTFASSYFGIDNFSNGIVFDGNVTITGTGSLNAAGGAGYYGDGHSCGIHAISLTINSGTVNAQANLDNYVSRGCYIAIELIINGGMFTTQGAGEAIFLVHNDSTDTDATVSLPGAYKYWINESASAFGAKEYSYPGDNGFINSRIYKYVKIDATVVPTVKATADAFVTKLNGNKNDLTIIVTETYPDGSKRYISKTFLIDNNAAGTYIVGGYNVYVDTKGNTQIRACYIMP